MRKLVLIPALLLIFPACGIDEDNFADSMARAWCSKQRECYRANYDDAYDNLDDCVEDVNDTYEGVQDGANQLGCELNGEEAADYRSEMLNAECSEFNDSFWLAADDAIWDC